jgi:hypothetical protein
LGFDSVKTSTFVNVAVVFSIIFAIQQAANRANNPSSLLLSNGTEKLFNNFNENHQKNIK